MKGRPAQASGYRHYLAALKQVIVGRDDGTRYYRYRAATIWTFLLITGANMAARHFGPPLPWWVDAAYFVLLIALLILPILGRRADIRARQREKSHK